MLFFARINLTTPLRIALDLRSFTPKNLVLAEAKEPTLRFHLQLLTNKHLLKIRRSTWHPLCTSLPFLIRSFPTSPRSTWRN